MKTLTEHDETVCAHIEAHGPKSAREIVAATGMASGRVYASLNKLQHMGILYRSSGEWPNLWGRVSAVEPGRVVIEQLREILLDVPAEFHERISQCIADLDRVLGEQRT